MARLRPLQQGDEVEEVRVPQVRVPLVHAVDLLARVWDLEVVVRENELGGRQAEGDAAQFKSNHPRAFSSLHPLLSNSNTNLTVTPDTSQNTRPLAAVEPQSDFWTALRPAPRIFFPHNAPPRAGDPR